jgi:iron complex transport system substrate-binding protein
LSGFAPNVESLIGMGPDLVVVADAPGDLVDGLKAVGVPLLVLPAATTIEDSYSQLTTLGRATGRTDAATEVAASMKKQIADVLATVKKRPTPLTYYLELDDTLFTATSKTFIGSVFTLVGLTNIADPADREGSGYPQLAQEFLLKSDPDLIFLADIKCCGQTAAIASARPGWSALKAVRSGAVVELDDDIASRWGPRIVELVAQVAAAAAKVPAKS